MDRTAQAHLPQARTAESTPEEVVDGSTDPGLDADLEGDKYWNRYTNEMAGTGFAAVLRRLPALLREAFGLAWTASRRDTAATIVLQTLAGVLTAVGLLATKGVLEQLLAAGPTPERIRAAVPALAWMAAAIAIRSGLSQAAGLAQARLLPTVRAAAELSLLAVTTRVELAAFDGDAYAEDLQRARQRGMISTGLLVSYAIDVLTAAVRFAGVGIALVVIHPVLLPVLILAALPSGWAAVKAARVGYLGQVQWNARMRRTWTVGHLLTARRHAPEVRGYDLGGYLFDRYRLLLGGIVTTDLQVAGQQARARTLGAMGTGIGICGVYMLLGVLLNDGSLPLAVAGAAVFAIQAGNGAFSNLVFAINSLYENALYVRDLTDVRERTLARAERTSTHTAPAPHEIELRDVTLTYPDTERPALDGVSLTIRAGQTIALVGPNGGGKSSLAKLLAATYSPTTGRVLWDGVDTVDFAPAQLREHLAVVGQDVAQWPLTAREAIRIGGHHQPTTQHHIETAARRAGAHDMITELPNGYTTLLDKEFKGGSELSQGQWQRLAAGRAFFRDAPVLICDEPSAALDPRAEHALFEELIARGGDKITVLITHRLANVRRADAIYLIDHGRIVEHGTHDQLLAAGGTYAELFSLQASGYLAERPTS
ncbi:ABC transporter ATP-binding protein [Longispora urticae]